MKTEMIPVDENGIQMEICRVCGEVVYALIKDDICAPCDAKRDQSNTHISLPPLRYVKQTLRMILGD